MVKPWVECLWAAWAASAVHVVNMVLKPSTLDMVRRAAQISVHSFSSFTAASADVVGVVVDDICFPQLVHKVFRVCGLAGLVVALVVLSRYCGLSLAAGWWAAASAPMLVQWASAVGSSESTAQGEWMRPVMRARCLPWPTSQGKFEALGSSAATA